MQLRRRSNDELSQGVVRLIWPALMALAGARSEILWIQLGRYKKDHTPSPAAEQGSLEFWQTTAAKNRREPSFLGHVSAEAKLAAQIWRRYTSMSLPDGSCSILAKDGGRYKDAPAQERLRFVLDAVLPVTHSFYDIPAECYEGEVGTLIYEEMHRRYLRLVEAETRYYNQLLAWETAHPDCEYPEEAKSLVEAIFDAQNPERRRDEEQARMERERLLQPPPPVGFYLLIGLLALALAAWLFYQFR